MAQVSTIVQLGHEKPITELAYGAGGRMLASTDGHNIKLWDVATGMEFRTLYIGEGQVFPIRRLQFLGGKTSPTLVYLYDDKLIYQDALSDKILEESQLQKTRKDTLDPWKQLENKYPARFTDAAQLQKYFDELRALENRQNEMWKRLRDSKPYQAFAHTPDGQFRLTRTIELFTKDEYKRRKSEADDIANANKRIEKKNKDRLRKNLPPLKPREVPAVPEVNEQKTELAIWKTKEGEPFLRIGLSNSEVPVRGGNNDPLYCTPDGQLALENGHLYSLMKGKPYTGKAIAKLQLAMGDNERPVYISENSKFLVTAETDTNGKCWIAGFSLAQAYQQALRKSKEKEILLDTVLLLRPAWRVASAPVCQLIGSLDTNRFMCLYFDFRMDMRQYATGQADSTSLSRVSRTGEALGLNKIKCLAINPYSQSLATVSYGDAQKNMGIQVWDLASGFMARSMGSHIAPVKFKALRLDSLTLSSAEYEHQYRKVPHNPFGILESVDYALGFRHLSLQSGDENRVFAPSGSIQSGDGRASYFADSNQIEIAVYNKKMPLVNSGRVTEFRISKNLKRATGVRNDTIMVWDAATGALLGSFKPEGSTEQVIFDSSDEIVACKKDGSISYLTPTGSEKARLPKPKGAGMVRALRVGNKIAWGHLNGTLNHSAIEKTLAPPGKMPMGTHPLAGGLKGRGRFGKPGFGMGGMGNPLETFRQVQQKIEEVKAIQADVEKSIRFVAEAMADDGAFPESEYDRIDISPDGKKLACWRGTGSEIYYYNQNRPGFKPEEPEKMILGEYLLRHETYRHAYQTLEQHKGNPLFDWSRTRILDQADRDKLAKQSVISENWTQMAVLTDPNGRGGKKYTIYQLDTQSHFTIHEKYLPVGQPYLSPSGRWMAASTRGDKFQIIRVWDLANKVVHRTFIGHSGALMFSKDERFLISSGNDRQIKIWDLHTENRMESRPLFSYIGLKGSDDFIIYTAEGYYYTSKGSVESIAFQHGEKAYPFEQFDLTFNRPDLVLRKIAALGGRVDEAQIESFYNAYLLRLQTLGVTEQETKAGAGFVAPPQLQIVSKETLPETTPEPTIALTVQASQSPEGSPIHALEVYVNGSPLPAADVAGFTGARPEKTIRIHLSRGINKIKVRATNTRGVHTLFETYIVQHVDTGRKMPTIFLVGIGATHSTTLPLTNLHQDLVDVIAAFRAHQHGKYNLVVDTLFEKRAGAGAIKAVGSRLRQHVSAHDAVIVFYSGHGLSRGSKEVELGVYDSTAGATRVKMPFTELENLMKDLPSRKKMLLVNACHSGEYNARPEVFSRMKDLFLTLNRGTGTNVLVSCENPQFSRYKGLDPALAKNSWFGATVLNGLKEPAFGGNPTVFQLSNYLRKQATEEQKPNARVLAIDSDFKLFYE